MRKILQLIAIAGFTTLALAGSPNSIKQKLAERVAAYPQLAETQSEIFEATPTILAQTTQANPLTAPVDASSSKGKDNDKDCGCDGKPKIIRHPPVISPDEECVLPDTSLGGNLGSGTIRDTDTEFQVN